MTGDKLDFVHTGPGTPAGRYLRRFWQPIYRAEDLARGQVVPVRIMSEDFTLSRGETGDVHLADPHRAHPTREYLGLIFAYLGEDPAPPPRRFQDMERPGLLKVGPPEYWPCNYFNRCENAVDAAHPAFTHRESLNRVKASNAMDDYRRSRKTAGAEETDYGIRLAMGDPDGQKDYVHFHMPNINLLRVKGRVEGDLADAGRLHTDRLFHYVPVDDESCVSFVVDLLPLTGAAAERYQERLRQTRESMTPERANALGQAILAGKLAIRNVDPEISTYYLFWIEDYVALVGQGAIADREHERLGRVDVGQILLRRMWQRELSALAEGGPLKQWTAPPGLTDMSMLQLQAVDA
jgi:5,5'-dehydrodivanillate O-demethylase